MEHIFEFSQVQLGNRSCKMTVSNSNPRYKSILIKGHPESTYPPRGKRRSSKSIWKCIRGRGRKDLDARALFEKFQIVIVILALLVLWVALPLVLIWDKNFATPSYAMMSKQLIPINWLLVKNMWIWRHLYFAMQCFNQCECIKYSDLKSKKITRF